MKYLVMICMLSLLCACGEEEETVKREVTPNQEVQSEVKDGVFTQYYPGTKKVKFEGAQDENGLRHGIWYFYSEEGKQMSMTEYKHGLKNGVSYLKYPNGGMRYTGSYKDDVQVGIWKTFDPSGKLMDSVDYDEINKKLNK